MKVAWVTHRDWDAKAGGAEAADYETVRRRPGDLKVTVIWPGGVDDELEEFDKVVVSGLYGFSSRELNRLAKTKPVFWIHDMQFTGHWFYTSANKLIFLTPRHQEVELKKLPKSVPYNTFVNPGPMDMSGLSPAREKQDFALWAHRPEAHKGLDLAAAWAKDNNVKLEVLVSRPRSEVIQQMRIAKYFVLLSHIFDPGPRAIMEAQLCGCELVINDNVGFFDVSREELQVKLMTAAHDFWEIALND